MNKYLVEPGRKVDLDDSDPDDVHLVPGGKAEAEKKSVLIQRRLSRVVSFKKPSTEELDHDYLWRVHRQVPGKGEVVVFNRSHYEDVLIVRVHDLVPGSTWRRRYDQINAFEQMLAEEGTVRVISTKDNSGRTTSGPTRTPSPRPPPTGDPGISSQPTRSGTETMWWLRLSPMHSRVWRSTIPRSISQTRW